MVLEDNKYIIDCLTDNKLGKYTNAVLWGLPSAVSMIFIIGLSSCFLINLYHRPFMYAVIEYMCQHVLDHCLSEKVTCT